MTKSPVSTTSKNTNKRSGLCGALSRPGFNLVSFPSHRSNDISTSTEKTNFRNSIFQFKEHNCDLASTSQAAGDRDAIDEACRRSPLGKLLPNALYIHRSALEELEPLLRVYEGCGQAYLGEIEEANLIKLHRLSGKISYVAYPDFETDPHPVLSTCVKLNMRSRQIDFYDYRTSENPPVLHRKETFLASTHPDYTRFARLTQQEVRHGLLDETATIGTRSGWQTRLTETGFRLAGHRLVRVKQ